MEKPLRLGIPHPPRDSHFPTAATTNFRLHFQCLDNLSYGYILKWLDRPYRTSSVTRQREWKEPLIFCIAVKPRVEAASLFSTDAACSWLSVPCLESQILMRRIY